MIDNIRYNQEFTNAFVEHNLSESPITDVLNCEFPAISFTQKVFNKYPNLFGINNDRGSSLFYALFSGRALKPEVFYMQFENFVKNSNINLFEAYINKIPLYCVEPDSLIAWAMYLQSSNNFYIFENVMNFCNKVLKSFFANNKIFVYKSKTFTIQELKPLLYNNVGLNIGNLIPYVAYIYNFFINCKPYTFNQLEEGNKRKIFLNALNDNFNNYYSKLITSPTKNNKKLTLAQLLNCTENIKLFSENTVKIMYDTMLNPNNIIDIRNEILIQNKGMLEECNEDQGSISFDLCREGFYQVLTNLIDIIIENNPVTLMFKKVPYFNCNINKFELSNLTHYALSGGSCKFGINDDEKYYASVDGVKKYQLIPSQYLKTEVQKSAISGYKPFASSNITLNLYTAYIKDEFDNFINDELTNVRITIDESFIDTEKFSDRTMEEILISLYVNGKWEKNSNSMNKIIKALMYKKSKLNNEINEKSINTKDPNNIIINSSFKEEILGIQSLSKLLQMFFDNKFGAKIIPAYILSLFNIYILEFMCNRNCGNLHDFSLMSYFCLNHKYNNKRVDKLIQMQKSIMFLYNKNYTNFVNKKLHDISLILKNNSFISQPYVKAISSNIDVYGIGGIELVNKSILSNPLERAYWFIFSTQGVSENVNAFYEWIHYINDASLYEFIMENIENIEIIRNFLVYHINKLKKQNNIPLILKNFKICNNGDFHMKNYPYIVYLKTKNKNDILALFCSYCFPFNNPKNTKPRDIYTRPIIYNNGNMYASTPLKNKILYGKHTVPISIQNVGTPYEIPVYDYYTQMSEESLTFTEPSGYRLIIIYTDSGRIEKNDLFFVFTNINNNTFNNIEFKDNFDTIYDTGFVKTDDNVEAKNSPNNRMKIMGLTIKPIADVANSFD